MKHTEVFGYNVLSYSLEDISKAKQIQVEQKLSQHKELKINLKPMEEIKFCKITSVEPILKNPKKEPGPDNPVKAYKLIIDTGTEARLVVSAIADLFTADYLLGKVTTFVLSLPPKEIRGFVSNGMIQLDESTNPPTLNLGKEKGERFIEKPKSRAGALLDKNLIDVVGKDITLHNQVVGKVTEYDKETGKATFEFIDEKYAKSVFKLVSPPIGISSKAVDIITKEEQK